MDCNEYKIGIRREDDIHHDFVNQIDAVKVSNSTKLRLIKIHRHIMPRR